MGILYYFSLHMFSMYYTFLQCIRHFSNVLQFIKQSKHQCLVTPVKPVNILYPVNNLEPIITLEPRGRRRPDLYANIPVPVLKVPAGEEGEPGGFSNFQKEEEKEEYNEEKEMMRRMRRRRSRILIRRRQWRGREGMRRICRTACWWMRALHCTFFPCISCYKVLSANEKLNNHIVEMHKDPASCILCYTTLERRTFFWGQLCALSIIIHLQILWKCLLERGKSPVRDREKQGSPL